MRPSSSPTKPIASESRSSPIEASVPGQASPADSQRRSTCPRSSERYDLTKTLIARPCPTTPPIVARLNGLARDRRCSPTLFDAPGLPDHRRDRPRENEERDHPVAERVEVEPGAP